MSTEELSGKFNFAQYIIQQNVSRQKKTAYIDDRGILNYGELSHRIRSMAAALLKQRVKPEERILLVLQDSTDFPIAFLGAMFAGIIPVPVNTLLTANDYAFMLENSKATAVIVSGVLLSTVEDAINQANHCLETIIVSNPVDTPDESLLELDNLLSETEPLSEPADTSSEDIGFWLYSSGSTGEPKGTVHTHGNPYWTAKLYGSGVLGVNENDICFSAAKLFFAYGLGNGLTFPLSVGASVVLMAERPTSEAVFKRWTEKKPTIFFGAPTGYVGMLASPLLPGKEQIALRLASSAGEALPAEIGKRFAEHFGIEIIDGIGSTEMLHIFLSNRPGKVSYGTTGWPVPGYDIKLLDDRGGAVVAGETGELYIRGPSSALMYWGNRKKRMKPFKVSGPGVGINIFTMRMALILTLAAVTT